MKKIFIIALTTLAILGIAFLGIIIIKNKEKQEGIQSILDKVETQKADIIEYIVYGTHLNIKGAIIKEIEDVENINLVLVGENGKEEILSLNYEVKDNKIEFWTSELLNEGIDLESFAINNYILLLEINGGSGLESKFYLLDNKTDHADIIYYTITKDKKNRRIEIEFSNGYMVINVVKSKLPKSVYDIVIDPGHGGSDAGASGSGYNESDLNLEYGKRVKAELEELGLKVKITRDGTENEKNFGKSTVYNENGRVNIVRRFKSKVCIFNSLK